VSQLDLNETELNVIEAKLTLLNLRKQVDTEKVRTLCLAKQKILESAVEASKYFLKNGLAPGAFLGPFVLKDAATSVFVSTQRLLKAKIALASSPEEHVALAEKILASAMELQETMEAGRNVFRNDIPLTFSQDVDYAKLIVLEAELGLVQEKKQDCSEKLRALSVARLNYHENAVTLCKAKIDAGMAGPEELIVSTEHLLRAKLEVATKLEERLALAEKILAGAKERQAIVEKLLNGGIRDQVDLLQAKLNVLEAEQMVLQQKKRL
jgi:hypothetical protein